MSHKNKKDRRILKKVKQSSTKEEIEVLKPVDRPVELDDELLLYFFDDEDYIIDEGTQLYH
jgi:hypothetical protein